MFYKRLQNIMKEKGMSIPDVSRATGLPDSTIRSILTRKSKTAALEVAAKISKGLNVSLEYLNGDDDTPNKNESPVHRISLEGDFLDFYLKYKNLDEYGRNAVKAVAEAEIKRIESEKEKRNKE